MTHPRTERGAIAVLTAFLLSSVLFGISAFVVDMGQAWQKRALLQTSVDLAVMAAAAELDQASGCNPEVVAAAEDYLSTKLENKVGGQYPIDLSDASESNGLIECTGQWKVRLIAPLSRVDYGLATFLDPAEDHLDVGAEATAQIMSPSRSSSLPMYAVSGCDTGHQVLTDPPPGPPPSTTPPVLSPNGTVDAKDLTVTPAEFPTGGVKPYAVTVGGKIKGATATMTGQVTFTNPDSGEIVPAGAATPMPVGSGYQSFSIVVPSVPDAVLDNGGIWWVRIRTVDGTTTNFSPTSEAEPFVVGDLVFCDGMVSGNFGTLKVARDDSVPAQWVERNIIKGLQPPLKVNASSVVPCSPVDSQHVPEETDCVGTDPGFPLEAATDGFIGPGGRLKVATTPGCDRTGGSALTGTSGLNDDVLVCFINNGHSVGDVIAGEPASLSAEIFTSPRFFQIPIIPEQAAHGASGAYPIIGFRPGFITDEPAPTTAQPVSVSGDNGLTIEHNKVRELRVVLFPPEALPETAPPVGGEIEYTGSGTKVLVLVD